MLMAGIVDRWRSGASGKPAAERTGAAAAADKDYGGSKAVAVRGGRSPSLINGLNPQGQFATRVRKMQA
jgi:hypothetical protein